MKTDKELQRDVERELAFDPSIDHAGVLVSVERGIVTLTGEVPTFAQKLAAEDAAARVSGVQVVSEEMTVTPCRAHQASDVELLARIYQLFRWDVVVPPDCINAAVEDGWVILKGNVEWRFERDAAHTLVSRIAGVRGVTNLIEIAPTAPSPANVHDRIAAAIARQGKLDSIAIHVSTAGNTVKLSGVVRGWDQRRIVEQAAWSVPGVTQVVDEIVCG